MQQLNFVYKKVHGDVKNGLILINLCIIDFIIKNNAQIHIDEIEAHTGLKNISTKLLADLIDKMVISGILFINPHGIVTGDLAELTKIVEQEKTLLPLNHGKPWSETDIIRLATLKLEDKPITFIAKNLHRTEKAINMESTSIRQAHTLIPIIERNPIVREFASKKASPPLI